MISTLSASNTKTGDENLAALCISINPLPSGLLHNRFGEGGEREGERYYVRKLQPLFLLLILLWIMFRPILTRLSFVPSGRWEVRKRMPGNTE
jgi:hypothetical protein